MCVCVSWGKGRLRLCETTSYSRPPFSPALTMPLLDVSPLLEVETSWSVDCILTGLFPASEAQVQVALGDQMLNATVESHGDNLTATATATASAEQEGTRQIVCNVTLGGDSRETRKNVTIYSKRGGAKRAPGGLMKGQGLDRQSGRTLTWAGAK